MGVLCACTPELNWREVSLGGDARASFPCRPQSDTRALVLAGQPVQMQLKACEAQGVLWAVSSAEVTDAIHATAALVELQRTLVSNLQGDETAAPAGAAASQPLDPGARRRIQILGKHADGSALPVRAAFVSKGNHVYQLVVLPRAGARLPIEDAQGYFFDNLRLDASGPRRGPGSTDAAKSGQAG